MAKYFVPPFFIVLFLLSRFTHAGQPAVSHTWKLADMKPEGIGEIRSGSRMEVEMLPGKGACGLPRCRFDLYYFKGDHFDLNDSGRKNILYVSGGPGQIVNRAPERRPLNFLETNHNVLYFDIRGAGLSTIDGDNKYDNFLRSDYVISDIEAIRLKELGPSKAWDAIYAHSAGTITALKYAATYGQAKVNRLILSAPVSKQRDTELARISMIASNIDRIYRTYIPCNFLIMLPFQLIGSFHVTDDLCFVQPEQRDTINKRLVDMLTQFNEVYGSAGFVIQNHEDLIRDEKEFRETHRYPQPFFKALRVLENYGAPAEGLAYDEVTKKRQIDAALLIGYYLSFEEKDLPADRDSPCNTNAPFWAGLHSRHVTGRLWTILYCGRLDSAKTSTAGSPSESVRANEVLGVYDGVSRSIFGMLKRQQMLDKESCFRGSDFIKFATNMEANTSKVARDAARRIGVAPDDRFCPWNPAKPEHKISIPTLILKGGADALINGCQAEDIFNDALSGKRALIEFHGAGHTMWLPIPENDTGTEGGGEIVKKILNIVLATPPTGFSEIVNRREIKEIKETRRGEVSSSDERGAHRLTCNMG